MALPAKAFCKADCDQCGAENVDIYVKHGKMSLCKACSQLEENLPRTPAQVMADARKADAQIQVRPDIHVAATLPLIELRAAIEHNESIPASDKEYVFAKEVAARREILNKAIFDQREELVRNENLRRAMDDAIANSVAKQTDARRREFRNFDVKYPVTKPTVRAVKSAATSDGPKKWRATSESMKELAAIARKYGVDLNELQMMMTMYRGKSPEDVAKILAKHQTEE